MPYLSWLEGSQLMRYAVREACQVGRDPLVCAWPSQISPNFPGFTPVSIGSAGSGG